MNNWVGFDNGALQHRYVVNYYVSKLVKLTGIEPAPKVSKTLDATITLQQDNKGFAFILKLVCTARFELAATALQTQGSTRLSYAQVKGRANPPRTSLLIALIPCAPWLP